MKLPTIPQQYRPSKKFMISVGVLAGAAVLIFGIRYLANHVGNNDPLAKIKVSDLQNPTDVDTDNDGLKDWEEALWGTDPNNPDTDTNGVPDGRQIEAMRAALRQQGTDIVIPPEELTETDKLARDIYTALVIATQESPDGELSEEDSIALQNKIIEYILRRTENFRQYQLSDLVVVTDSTEHIQSYATSINTITATFKNTQPQLFETIDDMANNVVTPEVATALGQKYIAIGDQIKNQSVPQTMASQHLALVNAFLQLGSVLQGLATVENDPLVAFVNSIAIKDTLSTLGDAFGNIGRLFQQ